VRGKAIAFRHDGDAAFISFCFSADHERSHRWPRFQSEQTARTRRRSLLKRILLGTDVSVTPSYWLRLLKKKRCGLTSGKEMMGSVP
jgi:hypothetical protein